MNESLLLIGLALTILGAITIAYSFVRLSKVRLEIEKMVLEAEKEKAKILSLAKDAAINDSRNMRAEMEREHQAALKNLRKKEFDVEKRFELVERKQEKIIVREKELEKIEKRLEEKDQAKEQELQKFQMMVENEKSELHRISGMSKDEARKILLAKLEDDLEAESKSAIRKSLAATKEKADGEARQIIMDAMQRLAHDVTTEGTTCSVTIPREDLKGKIIGRDGRNIRAFEKETGVDVIIDDSPEEITLSSFDVYRREVARVAMENLVKDGRIHPQRIEEIVRKVGEEMGEEIKKSGEQAVIEAGFNDVHPELMKLFGKLKFRHSYGQNQLMHALQVMELSEFIAGELGLDIRLAKRCGLLHDIGKAADQGAEGTHPTLGYEIAKKYGENPIVLNAIAAHHDGVEVQSIYTVITSVADAISAARPGARRESTEKYFERMKQLEEVAGSYDGVTKAYAMRAGRELRISVEAGKVSDDQSAVMVRKIAKNVEEKVTYPGEVKVTVIRETRYVEYAR